MHTHDRNPKLIITEIFKLSEHIRYIAININNQLSSAVAPSLENVSSSETDKYEELLVNPTLLFLIKKRGDIDCGGCEYIIIRYGNFFQFVRFLDQGHLSVGIQPYADVMAVVSLINDFLSCRNM